MVVSTTHSYRHAEAIMEKVYAQERQEILDVIASVNWAPMAKPKTRHRAGKVVATLDISQADTNVLFEKEFTNQGLGETSTHRVAVEIEARGRLQEGAHTSRDSVRQHGPLVHGCVQIPVVLCGG